MVCVYCGGATEVVNSRAQKRNNSVWRRRRCLGCGAVFSTGETVRYDSVWRVKHGKQLQPFSRLKLFMSLYRSCEHRKTALRDAEGLVDTVIGRLAPNVESGAINRNDITRATQVALARFDKAASVYYAARHKA